jgi:prephenate dehydrogenase
MTLFEHVTILGVGLIGGSLALSGRKECIFGRVTGVGRSPGNLEKAKELQAIDAWTTNLGDGVRGADLVVIATPVRSVFPLVKDMLPYVKKGAIITDVGSVKSEIINQIEGLSLTDIHFVGGHPIAGGEHSGVEAALASLFIGKKCILTPSGRTEPGALHKIKCLWESVGSRVVIMDSEEHDRVLGAVSHLPHMVAFALVNFLHSVDHSNGSIFEYSAGGLRDITRIASSHPVMWADIALMNREKILELLEGYERTCEFLRKLIDRSDWEQLVEEFRKSNMIRRNMLCDRETRVKV